MKVAVVTNQADPRAGGRFTFQHTLAAAIREAEAGSDHEFVFLTSGFTRDSAGSRGQLIRRALDHAITHTIRLVRDIQDHLLGLRLVQLRTPLERRLDAESVDLVWFTDFYAEECARPFVFTVFDLQHREQPWFPEVSQRGQFESRELHYRRFVPKATRVIVPNEVALQQLIRSYSIPRSHVLTLPHPTPRLAAAAGPHSNCLQGLRVPYILYPAQFWPHKNHATLLSALAEVNGRSEDLFQLVCVGSDRGFRAHIERIVDHLGLREHVLFPGFVTPGELVTLYEGAHALVYLSWFGPENLPPLEAGACGCPVVYADVAGARDQMGDAALLVRPDRPHHIADAILSLRDDALRSRLVEAGRQRAQENSVERYVAGVIEFLDEFELVRRCWA